MVETLFLEFLDLETAKVMAESVIDIFWLTVFGGAMWILARRYEAKRWARVAKKITYPARAHYQSIRFKGREYVVLTQHRYLGLVSREIKHD